MKLRKLGADAGAFAHLFGRKKGEEKKDEPAAETPPEDTSAEEDPAEADPDEEQDPEPDASEDGEDGEGDPDAATAEAEARGATAERARCRAIFAAPEAANNVALAAHLAFDTDQTAKQAVATLKLGGKSAAGGLGARMATAPNPSLGTEGKGKAAAGTPEAAAGGIMAAYRKATGKAA